MTRAPYDERNQADYLMISKNIDIALSHIESDPTIPATEVSLAGLANCSRGTLRNRVVPLEKLKEIKRRRAEREKNKLVHITRVHGIAVDTYIEDKKDLEARLKKSRDEIAMWFKRCSELEEELKKYRRTNDILQKGKELLEEKSKIYKEMLDAAGFPTEQIKGEGSFYILPRGKGFRGESKD